MQVSLVGQLWAAAAVLANTHVEVSLLDQAACQGLQDWLQQHAGRLRRLAADAQEVYRARTQLPWEQLPQLVSLRLRSLKVDLPPASIHSTHNERDAALASAISSSSDTLLSVPAAAAAAAGFLPALQRLELVNCQLPLDIFQQLSTVSSITSLTIRDLQLESDSNVPVRGQGVSKLLASLPHLSVLDLEDHEVPDVFELLPPSLTALQLRTSSPQQTAAAPQLSSLVQLQLQDVKVQASLLRSFPVLQRLKLVSVQVLCTADDAAAAAPQPLSLVELKLQRMQVQLGFLHSVLDVQQLVLRDLPLRPATSGQQAQQPGWGYASLADMLTAIGQMSRLQRLQLADLPLNACRDLGMLSSLTASSELQHLIVSGSLSSRPLPARALRYMLPASRQLPELLQLRIVGNPYLSKGETVDAVLALSYVHAACVRRLARCCPGLRSLALCHVLRDAAAVGAVTRLTTLTALSLAGPVCDDAATPAVAQLTGLRSLCWDALGTVQQNTFPEKAPAVVTVPGLRQLTALRALTSLELVGCGRITTTTLQTLRTAQQPDVWRQLQQLLTDAVRRD